MSNETGSRAHVFESETTPKLVLTVQAGREQPTDDIGLKNTSDVNQQFKVEWEGALLG